MARFFCKNCNRGFDVNIIQPDQIMYISCPYCFSKWITDIFQSSPKKNYCAIHQQWYDDYCVYCGKPSHLGTEAFCPECQKSTSGRCVYHSQFLSEDFIGGKK